MTNGVVDASDIYRAALVQAVAALDNYFHGVILDRGVDILVGVTPPTNATQVSLHLGSIASIVTAATPAERELAARTHLAQRLSVETYQQPGSIAQGLSLVGIPGIWRAAFPDPSASKTALGVVVRRRNQIAHQCDTDPMAPGQVIPLSDSDTLAAIQTVEITVKSIDPFC